MRSRRLLWLVPTLLLAALFTALGNWQLGRAELKARMLADFEATVNAAPQPIDRFIQRSSLPLRAGLAAARSEAAQPYDGPSLPARVSARGRFDDQATLLLDNQVLEGRPGAHVLVLFRPLAAARPLLVNLGWQPLPDRTQLVLPSIPEGEVHLHGLLVPPPAVGVRLGNAEWRAGAPPPLMAYFDIAALRVQLGADIFEGQLLLDEDVAFGLLRRWQALPNTLPPERHKGYAVQWFGLALALLVIYLVMARRRPRS